MSGHDYRESQPLLREEESSSELAKSDDDYSNLRRHKKYQQPRTQTGMRLSVLADPGYEVLPAADDDPILGGSQWDHGDISGDEAEKRLDSYNMRDGMFLTRKRGKEFVLSVCNDGRPYHYLIKIKDGRYSIGQDYPRFQDMNALVDYFRKPRDPPIASILIDACPKPGSARETTFDIAEPGSSPKRMTTSAKQERRRRKIERRDKLVKEQLANLPVFTPYFTKGTAFLMGVIMIIQLAKSYDPQQPVAKVAFSPQKEDGTPPVGMSQNRTEVFTKVIPSNFLIGPSATDLIIYGAKYAPCMRKDTAIFAELARQREYEQNNLGCCELDSGVVPLYGQTTQEDCLAVGGTWPQLRSKCPDTSSVSYRLRPCCLTNNGTCEITTEEYCDFFDGIWASDGQLCSETSCLAKHCGFTMKNNNPDQWYRFVIPIFLHGGLLHYAGVMLLQLSLGVQIERAAGWFRMMLIYMTAGIGGYVTSGVFSPDIPCVGASGCIFGLLGVSLVDLFQNWQIVDGPWKRLGYTALKSVALLLVGTIPFVDNWAHVGGFVFGILGGIIFLPYLTFGAWDGLRKRLFLCLCIPVLISLFFVLLLIFYEVQSTDFCPSCKYIQCIEWTSDFCENTPGWED